MLMSNSTASTYIPASIISHLDSTVASYSVSLHLSSPPQAILH